MKNVRLFAVAGLLATAAYAQHVISAKSGLVHYSEGKVTLAGQPLVTKAGEFPEVKPGQELRTEAGRVEILLTPGVFLRLSENSGVRMVTNALENTRMELTAGSALLEASEVQKDQALVIAVGGTTIEFPKRGLFRVDFSPAQLSVFDGSAVVVAGGQTITVKEGRRATLAGVIAPEKFNKEVTDAFHRWASRRASYIAMANIAAARSIEASGMSWRTSGWMYNPYFGAFTYIPADGRYRTPFGWYYYSPRTIESAFRRPEPTVWNPGAGMDAGSRGYADYGGRGSAGYSGNSSASSVSAPPPSSAPAAAAAPSRGSDGGGSGRESRGGR